MMLRLLCFSLVLAIVTSTSFGTLWRYEPVRVAGLQGLPAELQGPPVYGLEPIAVQDWIETRTHCSPVRMMFGTTYWGHPWC
jgi:hypothetical protein